MVHWRLPTSMGHLRMRRRVTKKDIQRYTEGDCHILAREIHYLTDWSMVSFGSGYPDTHAFVKLPPITTSSHPSRYYLDVNGVQSTSQMYDRWGKYLETKRIEVFTEEDFSKHWNTYNSHAWVSSFGSYSLRRARELAPFLVDLAQTQHLNVEP